MTSVVTVLSFVLVADAKITKVTGKVEAAAPSSANFATVAVGASLAEGSKLRTGPDSEALVQMDDGSQLKLAEKGSMLITSVKQPDSKKTSIVLFFGRLWAKVTKGTDRKLDIVTATAVAGVRGTEFTTAAGEDGQTRVQVDEGSVGVDNEKSQATVGGGQASEANGDAVGAPKSETAPNWGKWNQDRRQNLQKNGESIAKGARDRVDAKKREIDQLSGEQKKLKEQYKNASDADRPGIQKQLQKNASRLAELGVRAEGQFGAFDHWSELADDPEFGAKFLGSGFIRSELKRMRALRAEFQQMIAEGTDLSMKNMEKTIDDMRDGKKTLPDRHKKGNVDDMFNEEH